MRRFIRHIEDLLVGHDCVIVPGLGGFVCHPVAAAKVEDVLYPTRRRIGFNIELSFNDGLLAQSYQKEDGMSFSEACAEIKKRVEELKTDLCQGRRVQLGEIGQMSMDEAGRCIFTPEALPLLDASAFGLRPVVCAPLPKQNAPVEALKPQTVRPRRHRSVVVAAAMAACLLLALWLLPKTMSVSPSWETVVQEQASVVPTCSVADYLNRWDEQYASASCSVGQTVLEEKAESPANSEQVSVAAVQTAPVEDVIPSESVKPAAASATETVRKIYTGQWKYKNTDGQAHHAMIVIASFPDQASAERYIESKQLKNTFPQVGIALSEDRCRVFAELYHDKTEAVAALAAFRAAHGKYAKAWVLAQ